MFVNKSTYDRLIFLLLLVCLISCKEKSYSQPKAEEDSLIVNCYVIKPVRLDSKADTLRDFKFNKETLDEFLSKMLRSSKLTVYDSTMDFITSFEYQKQIVINYDCFDKLVNPNSCNLINIYFNSGFATWTKKKSAVQFIRTYRKNIYNFGSAVVYEYRFNNVAEIEPHFMYIILREATEDEQREGKDLKGFVMCSDGLDWKDYNERRFSIPLFKQMVRRSKELTIPLQYDGNRFIPIGHFKSKNWEE